MNNQLCPYCQSTIDEHLIKECGDVWMSDLLGWKTGADEDGIKWARVPHFMTSLDAQAEHVWPIIKKDGAEIILYNRTESITYKIFDHKRVIPTFDPIVGEDKDDTAFASWKACMKYLLAKKGV